MDLLRKLFRRPSSSVQPSDYFFVAPERLEGLEYEIKETYYRGRGVIDKVVVDYQKATVYADYRSREVAFCVYFNLAILDIKQETLIVDMELLGYSAVYYIREIPPTI